MPLNTASKRRSSVSLLQPWQVAPPSPTDTAGVIDQADREHIAWSYSGILAETPPLITIFPGLYRPIWRPRRGR